MATLEIRKETDKVWKHIPSNEPAYIVSKLYIKSDGDNIRVVELGGSQRGIYNVNNISLFDIGGTAETFTTASDLMQRLEALGYIGFFYEGEVSPSILISSDLYNAITLGSDGKLYVDLSGVGSVDSVNGQTGIVVLNADDISDATTTNKFVTSAEKTTWNNKQDSLGYTPENVSNKENTILDTSTTKYPTNRLVKENLDLKQNSLGYTPENVANKSTSTTLGTSDTLYPTQNAVKTYVDLNASKIQVISIQNRWTLTNVNLYYRSRGDFAGFNEGTLLTAMTGTTDYNSLTQANRSNSSFFYVSNGAKKLDKIYLDVSSTAVTTNNYTIMVVACQKLSSSNINTSTINGINLGEYTLSKLSGNVNDFYVITPNDVTIPDGYVVTYFIKRADGTAEINVTAHFHFKNA